MLSKLKYSALVLLGLGLSSCEEEFLDTTPTDAIAAADALATESNIRLIIDGMHRAMYSQSQTVLPGGDDAANTAYANEHYWVPLGDNLGGGLIHSADANNLSWRTQAQWVGHTDETSLVTQIRWYHRYNIIYNANTIINRVAEGELTMTPELNYLLGQALAYRAYAYLDLVQHYAKGYLVGSPATDPGVPILFSSDAPFESAGRSTVQEVYDQVFADLDAAIAAFADGIARPTGSAFHKADFNSNVAQGLKARAALASGKWAMAAEAAAKAREGFPIMGEADWKSGFNTTLLPEVMWGSNVIGTETTFFRSYFYLASNTFNGSQNRNNPKIADRRLIDSVPETDYRKDLFLVDAPNSNTSAANGLGGYGNADKTRFPTRASFDAERARLASEWGWVRTQNTHPYMQVKLRNSVPGTIEPDDIIYMRASEMVLIQAEALNELGQTAEAVKVLSELAKERDPAWNGDDYDDSQETFLEHIKFQRGIELWGEGFLFQDKIRWDDPIDHGANGGSGASETLYQAGYRVERPSLNDDWVWKIPQREIDANPNLTAADQNP